MARTSQQERRQAYAAMLKDPRWQKKRLEILERDEWTCQWCFDKESTLHVHHMRYVYNRPPWETPDEHLITLCEACHESETESRRTEEGRLLDFLAANRYDAGTIAYIVEVLHFSRLLYPPDVVWRILHWHTEDESRANALKKAYFDHLAAKRIKNEER